MYPYKDSKGVIKGWTKWPNAQKHPNINKEDMVYIKWKAEQKENQDIAAKRETALESILMNSTTSEAVEYQNYKK